MNRLGTSEKNIGEMQASGEQTSNPANIVGDVLIDMQSPNLMSRSKDRAVTALTDDLLSGLRMEEIVQSVVQVLQE